ncbi:MAG: ParB/RepB/Spo0J family partition protein [Pseudomonadota bacterium]
MKAKTETSNGNALACSGIESDVPNPHESSAQMMRLDPTCIVASTWANRHPDAFKNSEFERLKEDIAQSGGNVQAIQVRSFVSGRSHRYEIVFGHRRHRACAELGLPVLATIDDKPVNDAELFALMHRENRQRADLSPYEQGIMYRRALDAGLFTSNRRLAEALGVSHTWVGNAMIVSYLPDAVLECFRTPLEVQYRHALKLWMAMKVDAMGVLRRAASLCLKSRLRPDAVVAALVGSCDKDATLGAKSRELTHNGRLVGHWRRDRAGRVSILVDMAGASDEMVRQALGNFLKCIDQQTCATGNQVATPR